MLAFEGKLLQTSAAGGLVIGIRIGSTNYWPTTDYNGSTFYFKSAYGNEVDGNDENDVPVYSAIEPELFTIQSDG